MSNTTFSLNSKIKYYPIDVLLKNQDQELPEDVDPAKKEVSLMQVPLPRRTVPVPVHGLGHFRDTVSTQTFELSVAQKLFLLLLLTKEYTLFRYPQFFSIVHFVSASYPGHPVSLSSVSLRLFLVVILPPTLSLMSLISCAFCDKLYQT